jgi:ATP-binding cassette subfamily C protein
MMQFFHGFKEIILLGKKDAFISAYQAEAVKKATVQATQMVVNILPRMVMEVLFVGLFVLTIVFLCYSHETPVGMMGVLGGYLYAGFRLMPGLNRILNQSNIIKLMIPCVERVHDEYHRMAKQENYLDVKHFKFMETIAFKDMSFRYVNTKKDVLKKVSLTIQKGECIGIVGETGSGKSTLVDLILGLLKPTKGAVLVDGEFPVHAYQWHQKIGYVPQSLYLMDKSVEENIAFGEQEIDHARLNAAIDAAQLRKFIANLPLGIKTIVGERGVRLSGGERQRIAIARALYHEPEVLIFDEATSALDQETEARLMETIHEVIQHRTVIMIAHRLTTLKDCDRIVRMENGAIAEITTYDHLQR